MGHLHTFDSFVNEDLKVISETKLGDVTIKKTEGGWLFTVPSKMGRGVQVVALVDDQIPELIKILQEK